MISHHYQNMKNSNKCKKKSIRTSLDSAFDSLFHNNQHSPKNNQKQLFSEKPKMEAESQSVMMMIMIDRVIKNIVYM